MTLRPISPCRGIRKVIIIIIYIIIHTPFVIVTSRDKSDGNETLYYAALNHFVETILVALLSIRRDACAVFVFCSIYVCIKVHTSVAQISDSWKLRNCIMCSGASTNRRNVVIDGSCRRAFNFKLQPKFFIFIRVHHIFVEMFIHLSF